MEMINSYSSGSKVSIIKKAATMSIIGGMGLFITTGSGGSAFTQSTEWSHHGNSSSLSSNPLQTQPLSSNQTKDDKIAKQIEFIKDVFKLSNEKLADILGIERKTLHNWEKSNAIPRENSRQKFFSLFTLAKDWLFWGYPTDSLSLHKPVLGSESVLTALSSLDKDRIFFIGRYLLRQENDENNLI